MANGYNPFTGEGQPTPPEDVAPPPEEVEPEAAVQAGPPREPQTMVRGKPGKEKVIEDRTQGEGSYAQLPTPGAGMGGSGGGGLSSEFAKRLEGDYSGEEAAAQEEIEARRAYAGDVGGAMGEQANTERGEAMAAQAQARAAADQSRNAIAEIGQLVHDYAAEKIDPNRWWSQKSVPQKVAAVLGGMFAGLGGGVQGAMAYYNNMVDRDLALQQEEIHRKGTTIAHSQNLLYSFMKSSNTEQEAFDKTRAAMINAAMVDVGKAAVIAKSPVETAQIKELMAAMKTQRDMALAKLMAAARGGGGSPLGLAVDPKTLVTDPEDGQKYLTDDPSYSDDMKNQLIAISKIKSLLQEGQALLQSRTKWDLINPIASENLRRGEDIDGLMKEYTAKLANARGLPASINHLVQGMVPQFGSRFAELDKPKIDQMVRNIGEAKGIILEAGGAVPAQIQLGPGAGKHAGSLVYYAKPMAPISSTKPVGQSPPKPKPSIDFQPNR